MTPHHLNCNQEMEDKFYYNYCFMYYILFNNTSFKDRVLIPAIGTRKFLSEFSAKGLSLDNFHQLMSSLESVIADVVVAAKEESNSDKLVVCKKQWRELVHTLSSASAVCGYLHPSPRSADLVVFMTTDEKDITTDALQMRILLEELPVIFNLVSSFGHYPRKVLSPLLKHLWAVANQPFKTPQQDCIPPSLDNCQGDLGYFPNLPKHRDRGWYVADKRTTGAVCTKKKYKQLSLLPGVFTLFCQHGIIIYVF